MVDFDQINFLENLKIYSRQNWSNMCNYIWNVTKTHCQKVLTFYWDSLYISRASNLVKCWQHTWNIVALVLCYSFVWICLRSEPTTVAVFLPYVFQIFWSLFIQAYICEREKNYIFLLRITANLRAWYLQRKVFFCITIRAYGYKSSKELNEVMWEYQVGKDVDEWKCKLLISLKLRRILWYLPTHSFSLFKYNPVGQTQ